MERQYYRFNPCDDQKIEAIERFAAGIAHDMNNLLSVINADANLLQKSNVPPVQAKRLIDQIAMAGAKAEQTIGQLLNIGRRKMTSFQTIELREFLAKWLASISETIPSNVRLIIASSDTIATIYADVQGLEQALCHLALNACQAMPDGGQITVEYGPRNAFENTTVIESPVGNGPLAREEVVLRVIDNGIGIKQDELPKIFDPYFTTKDSLKTRGLGLSSVYAFAKQCECRIDVETCLGEGTCIQLAFPSQSCDESRSRKKHKVILLCEESPFTREWLRSSLSALGFHVLEATSGQHARDVLSDSGDLIDVVLISPQANETDKLDSELRSFDFPAGLKLVCMVEPCSAWTGSDKSMSHDVHWIEKPFSPAQLASKINEVISDSK